jgi:hypothetical protein
VNTGEGLGVTENVLTDPLLLGLSAGAVSAHAEAGQDRPLAAVRLCRSLRVGVLVVGSWDAVG